MTLAELRYVVTLAQTCHFGQAAEQCCVSQPSLSIAINKLEARLGVCIFERKPKAVQVTEVGEKIVAQARRALAEVATIDEIAKACKSQLTMPLRIGAIFTVAPYLFPALIPKLNKVAPEMPLIVQEDYTANLRVKLQQGQLDAAFIALPFTESGVLNQVLYTEPFVILLQKNHPLAKSSKISAKHLGKENVLLLGEQHCFRQQVLAVCPNCNPTNGNQHTVEGTSLETLRHMVASGMGITVLPSSATQIKYYNSTLCTKPFAGKTPKRQIALAWRVSFPRPKAITAVLQAVSALKLAGVCLLPNHSDSL